MALTAPPPKPQPANVGSAYMQPNGTLEMSLRTETQDGTIGEAFLVIPSCGSLPLKDTNLHGELIDYALRVFDGCGRSSLANGHFGTCGIEHTDRLVRELSSRDVAMRQPRGRVR